MVQLLILFLILGALVFVGLLIYSVVHQSESSGGWHCPHGYDDFGCQPSCPLHAHCWGESEK